MQEILTAAEMKALDEYTIHEIGVPSMVLMERAALAVAEELQGENGFDAGAGNIAVISGTGNNGGDGVAVARLLHLKGYHVAVILIGERERCTEETKLQLRIAENYGVMVREGLTIAQIRDETGKASIIIDALFGIGLSRNLEGVFKAVVDEINAAPAKVIAIDIPSGLSADTGEILGAAVKAHMTVALAYMKAGLTKEPALSLAGRVKVKDIGIYSR